MRFNISHILWMGLFHIDVGIQGLPTDIFQRDLIHDVPIKSNSLIAVFPFHHQKIERTIPDVHFEKRAGGKKKKKPKPKLPPIVTTPGGPSTDPTKPKDPSPKKNPKDDPKKDPKDDPKSPKDDPKSPKDDPKSPKDYPKSPKDDPKSPAKSPKDDPKKSPKDPNSPDSPKTPPDTPSPKEKIYLGKCGSQTQGKMVDNVPPKNKSPNSPKIPISPKSKGGGEKPGSITGTKVLWICGTSAKAATAVVLKFPRYPSSGDIFTSNPKKYKTMDTYNAVDEDPCKNDYAFGKRAFPKKNTDGLWTPEGEKRKDTWQTEHIFEPQILKAFFKEQFEDRTIPRDDIPEHWRTGFRGRKEKMNQCAYLQQFWVTRGGSYENSAMSSLLEVFPGANNEDVAPKEPLTNKYEDEMVLLPGRLNNQKASVFSVKPKEDVVSLNAWNKASVHEKIDRLREMVLLIKYMNEAKIQEDFKAVVVRIKTRLHELEADDGQLRKTDDYWHTNRLESTKKEDDPALKDKDDEKYVSLDLSTRWETWVYKFVSTRVDYLEELKTKYHMDLKATWKQLKVYRDLEATDKTEIQTRMDALEKAINVKINISGLVDKPKTPPSSPKVGPPVSIPVRPKPKPKPKPTDPTDE